MQLYLKRNGKILGPFDEKKVLSLYQNKKILPTHEVSVDQQNWQQIFHFVDQDEITGRTPSSSAPPPVFKPKPSSTLPLQKTVAEKSNSPVELWITCFKLLFTPMNTVAKIKEKYNDSEIWAASFLYYIIPVACLGYFVYFELRKYGGLEKQDSGEMIIFRFAEVLLLMIFCSFISIFIIKLCVQKTKVPIPICVLTGCGAPSYIAIGSLAGFLCTKHFNPATITQPEQWWFLTAAMLFIIIFTIASSICYLYGSLLKVFKIQENKIVPLVSVMICSSILLFAYLVKLIWEK